jgi:hypothetical protein
MNLTRFVLGLALAGTLAGAAEAYTVDPGLIPVNHVFGTYLRGAEANGDWTGAGYGYSQPSSIGDLSANTIFDTGNGAVRDGSWIQENSGAYGFANDTWDGVGSIWDLGAASSVIDVFPFIDHVTTGETALQEGTEFRVFGSNDLSNWTAASFGETWAQGYNAATIYDDYASRWSFGRSAYRYVGIEAGNWETKFDSGDSEIDAVARPVPEPASLFLLGGGMVGLAGLARRRRKGASAIG